MGTKSAWTPERRAKQAEAIRKWKPWERSTGPRTEAGKARSSRNAERPADMANLHAMMERARVLTDFMSYFVLMYGERPISGEKVKVDRKKRERLRQSLIARGAFEPAFQSQLRQRLASDDDIADWLYNTDL